MSLRERLEWTDAVAILFTLLFIYTVGNDVVGTNPNAEENIENEWDECIKTTEGLECRNYLSVLGYETDYILVSATYGVTPAGDRRLMRR